MSRKVRELAEEIASELSVPYELEVPIPPLSEPLDVVIPSSKRAIIAVKIIEVPGEGGLFPFPMSHKGAIFNALMTIDEIFEHLKRIKGPIVCMGILEKIEHEIIRLLDEIAYMDEILEFNPSKIAHVIEKISRNPWYPTFVIIRHSGKELLGLAPLGRKLNGERIKAMSQAYGFIAIDPLTNRIYIRNIAGILRMVAEAVNIPVSDIKLKELKIMLNEAKDLKVRLGGWIKELLNKEEESLGEIIKALITKEVKEHMLELNNIRHALRVLGITHEY